MRTSHNVNFLISARVFLKRSFFTTALFVSYYCTSVHIFIDHSDVKIYWPISKIGNFTALFISSCCQLKAVQHLQTFRDRAACQLQSMYLLILLPTPFLHLVSCISSLSLSLLISVSFFIQYLHFLFIFAHTLLPFQTVALSYSCFFSILSFLIIAPLF